MRRLVGLLGLLLVVFAATSVLGFGPVVMNREGEQRIAFLLGDPVRVIEQPGLSLTPPFVNIQVFDGRWRHLSAERREIATLDQERIMIDHFVVWRISDPLQFRRTFPSGLTEAEKQIDQQVRGQLREVIGQKRLMQVLKGERRAILDEITQQSNDAVKRFGVDVRDVRINRTELPQGTEANVYARMRAERDRLARKYRAEGEEQARAIRAEADRESQVIVAEARRDAEVERPRPPRWYRLQELDPPPVEGVLEIGAMPKVRYRLRREEGLPLRRRGGRGQGRQDRHLRSRRLRRHRPHPAGKGAAYPLGETDQGTKLQGTRATLISSEHDE